MTLIRDQIRLAQRRDGGDHINVSFNGKTEIGRSASLDYRRQFFIPHLGDFGSARNFAQWLCSDGNDTFRFGRERFDSRQTSLHLFRGFLLYAKFYQILSIRNFYQDKANMLNLPWASYRVHLTGIREHDRWSEYHSVVKEMIRHVVENEPSAPVPWKKFLEQGVIDKINDKVRQIAINAGQDPSEIVDLIDADAEVRKRRAQREEQRAASEAPRSADDLETSQVFSEPAQRQASYFTPNDAPAPVETTSSGYQSGGGGNFGGGGSESSYGSDAGSSGD